MWWTKLQQRKGKTPPHQLSMFDHLHYLFDSNSFSRHQNTENPVLEQPTGSIQMLLRKGNANLAAIFSTSFELMIS
jgi:hypothetical protein